MAAVSAVGFASSVLTFVDVSARSALYLRTLQVNATGTKAARLAEYTDTIEDYSAFLDGITNSGLPLFPSRSMTRMFTMMSCTLKPLHSIFGQIDPESQSPKAESVAEQIMNNQKWHEFLAKRAELARLKSAMQGFVFGISSLW